jgi:SH3-like domain-containing protein
MNTKFRIVILLVIAIMVAAVPTFASEAQGCQVRTDWTTTHTVQRGETLARIARIYGTTWTVLAQGNCLINPNFIYAGQVLRIPTGNSPQNPPPVNQVILPYYPVNLYLKPVVESGVVNVAYGGYATAVGRTATTAWLYIRTAAGAEGWLQTYHVPSDASFIASLPVLSTADESDVTTGGYPARVWDNYVRLRQGPGFAYTVLRLISYEEVVVHARSADANWLKVRTLNGQTGWMWSYYIDLDASVKMNLPVQG